MPPIFVPSIWDYLAQAGNQTIDSYHSAEERRKAEEARKRAEALQGLQFTMGLEQQGLVPYTQVNQQIQQNAAMLPYLKGVQMTGPSAGGLQAQIANTPDVTNQGMVPNILPQQVRPMTGGSPNVVPAAGKRGGFPTTSGKPEMVTGSTTSGIDQFTDAQRRRAGLPTKADVEAQNLGITKTKQDLEAGAFNLERGKVTAAEEDAMLPVRRLTALKPVLEDNADAFVSKEYNKVGGHLKPSELDAMSQRAYAQFLATKGNTELLKMTPDQGVLARSYFDRAVRNAYERQQEMDLRKQIAAIQAGGRQGNSPAQIANALSTAASKYETAAKNIEQSMGSTLTLYNFNPNSATPETKAKIAQIAGLRERAATVMRAQSGFAAGLVTPEMATQLLMSIMNDSTMSGAAQVPGAMPHTPPPSQPGQKRQITEDQKQYLMANGKWDPSMYEVVR